MRSIELVYQPAHLDCERFVNALSLRKKEIEFLSFRSCIAAPRLCLELGYRNKYGRLALFDTVRVESLGPSSRTSTHLRGLVVLAVAVVRSGAVAVVDVKVWGRGGGRFEGG